MTVLDTRSHCRVLLAFLVFAATARAQSPAAVDVRAAGATGDGKTDDGPAIRKALAQLIAAGGGELVIPPGRYRVVATAADICLGVQGNITIRGVRGASVLSFESDMPADYREGVRVAGDRITLDGVTVTRKGPFGGILLKVYPSTRLTLRGCTLDGAVGTEPAGVVHGIEIAAQPGGVTEGMRLDDCDVVGCVNGLFGTNDSTAILHGFVATGCRFRANFADLDFNAPKGALERISVVACDFADGAAPSSAAGGFAVGMANAQHSRIVGCDFHGYKSEVVHLEDRTADVAITGCSFADCAGQGYAIINLINGTSRVAITANHFDASALAQPTPCVLVTTGGNFPVAGEVVVSSNTFDLGAAAAGVEAYGSRSVSILGNIFTGSGPGATCFGVSVRHATAATVSGNMFNRLGRSIFADPSAPPVDSLIMANSAIGCSLDAPPSPRPTPAPAPASVPAPAPAASPVPDPAPAASPVPAPAAASVPAPAPIAALHAAAGGAPGPVPGVAMDAPALLALHNAERTRAGLAPLQWAADLATSAREHVAVMAAQGKLQHDGIGDGTLISRATAAGYDWSALAENIEEGSPDDASAMSAWMASPPHRANVLGPYSHMGAGSAADGSGTRWYCVDFGKPR